MTDMNPMIVIVTMIFLMIASIILLENRKRKKKIEKIEGVTLFGEKVTTQDYFSFCNTCIAYLLIDSEKALDLKLFIPEKKLESPKAQESMRMIEQTINLFPIISCVWDRGTKFIVDEEKTIKKVETYQKSTKTDDYIVPLFDIGLVSRNPNLFNASTQYQQAKTIEKILTTKGIGDQFEGTDEIVRGLNTLSEDGEKYVVPAVFFSERNMDYDNVNGLSAPTITDETTSVQNEVAKG